MCAYFVNFYDKKVVVDSLHSSTSVFGNYYGKTRFKRVRIRD